jgi:hypothetical protein
MVMERDFLNPAPPAGVEGAGMGQEIVDALTKQAIIFEDIRRELMKLNPEVLAVTKVQGSNTIAANDSGDKRVYFEVGGKAVTVYRILIHSTYTSTIGISVNSMSKRQDGMSIAANAIVQLDIAVDSLHVSRVAATALSINDPSDGTNGGLFIYGWTIPDFERNRR